MNIRSVSYILLVSNLPYMQYNKQASLLVKQIHLVYCKIKLSVIGNVHVTVCVAPQEQLQIERR